MAFALDDAWDNCPEIMRAGTPAAGLYARCGAWVARNLTDGYVPAEVVAAYGSPEWARRLVDVGLFVIADGGYTMPHYLDRNPSKAKVDERRKADADRKAKWRDREHRKRNGGRPPESAGSHGVTPPVTPLFPTPPKGGKARASPRPPSGRQDPEAPVDWRNLPVPTQLDEQQRERNRTRAAEAREALAKPPRKDEAS